VLSRIDRAIFAPVQVAVAVGYRRRFLSARPIPKRCSLYSAGGAEGSVEPLATGGPPNVLAI
jgi:hypothetical protein